MNSFSLLLVTTKKQIPHSQMHRSRSLLQNRSCWSGGSRRPGCRRGRSHLQQAQRSPPRHERFLELCWQGKRKGSRSWGSPEQRRPPPLPSAGRLPSLHEHRCCCHGEGSLTHDEAGPQKHYAEAAVVHKLQETFKNQSPTCNKI